MSKAIYVGFTANNTPAVSVLLQRSSEVSELIPVSFSPRIIELLRRVLGSKLHSIFASRAWAKKIKGVRRKYYGLTFIVNPIINHFGLKRISDVNLRKLALQLDICFLKRNLKNYDIRIIPGDFLESIPDNSGINILEVRWHHTMYNSKRPPVLLNYPVKQVLQETYWESVLRKKSDKIGLIVTYSSIARESFIYAGFSAAKIVVVPLNPEIIKYPESRVNVSKQKYKLLYVGRDAPDKGLDIAVFAARKCNQDLIVVGSFSREVENWLKNFSFVNYMGILSRNELFKVMSETEILLAPSIESFGLAVLEAIAAGMKIVASPYIGVLEFLEDNTQIFKAKTLEVEDFCKQVGLALIAIPSNITGPVVKEFDMKAYWDTALDQV